MTAVLTETSAEDGPPTNLDLWAQVTEAIDPQQWPPGQSLEPFVERLKAMTAPRVLELGTRQSIPGHSTSRRHLFPFASEFVGSDIEPGVDVNLVADVHRLSQFAGVEAFDIIITDAGFEHFKYPHLAAHEIMKTLRIGGLVFVQTHQTFPIHAVPYDYFRFSTDALRSLFGTRMGMNVLAAAYASPAAIYSRVDPEGHKYPAFLHVNLCAEKVAPTPDEFVYEYDCLVE